MQAFHGDLLIGGIALRNVDGMLDEAHDGEDPLWCGQFEVDRGQEDVLEIGRQYLLMLDDGRNREVMLTKINLASEAGPTVCTFADCGGVRRAQ